jgi:putative endonuclease
MTGSSWAVVLAGASATGARCGSRMSRPGVYDAADVSADTPGSDTPRWFVYLLRCADGTFYAGSTTDVDGRARAHNEGRGAKYTSGRRPVSVVYREACESRSGALRREHALKRLTRVRKEALAAAWPGPGRTT